MEVDLIKKRLENKLQFWSVLGPCIVILTLLISLIKYSPESFYLPLAVVVGIPSCWMWKQRGMFGSIVLLVSLLALSYPGIDPQESLWHLGVCLAVALSFVVGTLSSEEVSALVQRLQAESGSRLEHLLRLDEKLKHANEQLQLVKEEADVRVHAARSEQDQLRLELETLRKSSFSLDKDYQQLSDEKQQLLQKHLELQSRLNDLQREDPKETPHHFESDTNHHEQELERVHRVLDGKSQELAQLNQILEDKEQVFKSEKEELQAELALKERELTEALQKNLQPQESLESRKTEEFLRKQIEDRDYKLYMQVRRQAESQKQLLVQQSLLQEYKKAANQQKGNEKELFQKQEMRSKLNHVRTENYQLKLDNESLLAAVARVSKRVTEDAKRSKKEVHFDEEEKKALLHTQSLYKQLKVQFDQKSQILHQTRAELFKKESELLALLRANEISSLDCNENEALLEKELVRLQQDQDSCLAENAELVELMSKVLGETSHIPK